MPPRASGAHTLISCRLRHNSSIIIFAPVLFSSFHAAYQQPCTSHYLLQALLIFDFTFLISFILHNTFFDIYQYYHVTLQPCWYCAISSSIRLELLLLQEVCHQCPFTALYFLYNVLPRHATYSLCQCFLLSCQMHLFWLIIHCQ